MPRPADRLRRLALAVWVAAFAGATANHIRDFLTGGLRPYAGAPAMAEVFWTLLVGLDPLVVVLLLTRRKLGLATGLAVMVADVALNGGLALAAPGRLTSVSLLMLLSQTAFLGVVVGSIAWLWPRSGGLFRRSPSAAAAA